MMPSVLLDRDDKLDLAAVAAVIGLMAFFGFSFHAYVMLKQAFDPMGFGTGLGSVIGGGGIGKFFGNKGDYGQ